MAQKRMLNKSISISKQVNSLSLKDRLLFTWSLPHMDDWGYLDKDPEVIKAIVVPMAKDVTEGDIEKAMENMKEIGLIEELSDCYFFKGFDNHQSISKSKKTNSKFEAKREGENKTPTQKEKKSNSVSKPLQATKKEKTTQPSSGTLKNKVNLIYKAYEDIFDRQVKVKNADRNRKIKKRLKTFSVEDIKKAFLNASKDDFIMGKADNNDKFYATIDYFMRNDTNIEKWIDNAPKENKEYIIHGKKVSKEEYETYKNSMESKK